MTSDPIIVSVPHCGTRFLKERLGIKEHVHTHQSWNAAWDRVEGREVIVPLREPSLVLRSWCRREHPRKFPVGTFFMAWSFLHAIDQMIDVDVICVDKQEDPRIDDWTPIGEEDGSHAGWKLHKFDLRPIHNLPIVQRHYGPAHLRRAA